MRTVHGCTSAVPRAVVHPQAHARRAHPRALVRAAQQGGGSGGGSGGSSGGGDSDLAFVAKGLALSFVGERTQGVCWTHLHKQG